MRRFVLATSLLCVPVYVFAACSDSKDGSTATTPDAGNGTPSNGDAGSSPDGATSPNSCSNLEQAGSSVDIVVAKPPQPDAGGGTPVDGTFVLKSVRAFTDIFPEGNTIRAFGAYTVVIGGGGTTFEQVVTNPDNEVTVAKGALTVDGVNFKATPDCEAPLGDGGLAAATIQGTYTQDPTTLKMYVVRDFGITAELAFEKR